MRALEIALWVVAVLWAFSGLNAVLNLVFLPRLAEEPLEGDLPTLSVVIPARNEEADIETAVTSHCSQDYPGLQVVVVDDRSTDATPAILKRLEERFPNLLVVGGTEPEAGWFGKQNALRVGLRHATGTYVLFTDADVHYGPGLYRRMVGEMVRRRLDFLTLMAWVETRGLEPLIISRWHAMGLYGYPTCLVNVPALRGASLGLSQGMLILREAFNAAGGLEKIRGEGIDDLALGRMMKAYRGRMRLVTAFRATRWRMYRGIRACVDGLAVNCYNYCGRNPLVAAWKEGAGLLMETLPLATALGSALSSTMLPIRLPSILALAAGAACNLAVALWARYPLWVAIAFPVRPLIWAWITFVSAWRYYRHGFVWRGRTFVREG